jgi:hypothetical protein
MKICMIGDSHLAMMLNAQKEEPIKGLDITPVTWPRHFHEQFTLRGTQLCADGPGLVSFWKQGGLGSKIDLTAFDRLVYVSFTATQFSAFHILREHVVSGWNDAKPVIRALNAPMEQPDRRRLLTPAVFNQCLAGVIRENYAYTFTKQIRKHSDIPIAVVPAPFLAENVLTHRPKLWGLKRILRANDGEALAQSLNDAHQIAFGGLENVSVLRQPKETVACGCLTAERYREGAKRYGTTEAHSTTDILHAGPLLGRLLMKMIHTLDT